MDIESSRLHELAFQVGTKAFEYTGLFKLLYEMNNHNDGVSGKRRRVRGGVDTPTNIICSPLHAEHLPESVVECITEPVEDFVKAFSKYIHLLWDDRSLTRDIISVERFSDALKHSILFEETIQECIEAMRENGIFIIISFFIRHEGGGHVNYIIIHDDMAFRIEPHGLGQEVAMFHEAMEVELTAFFAGYGINYIPHTSMNDGNKLFGVQRYSVINKDMEHLNPVIQRYMELRPGLCCTYVFMYITLIISIHLQRGLRALELFTTSIKEIDETDIQYTLDKVRKYKKMDVKALLANQEITQWQVTMYHQLLEIPLISQATTRGRLKKILDNKANAKLKVAMDSIHDQHDTYKDGRSVSPGHRKLDIEMYDTILDILKDKNGVIRDRIQHKEEKRGLESSSDLLNIYGIQFNRIISSLMEEPVLAQLRKKKKGRRKKKKATEKKKGRRKTKKATEKKKGRRKKITKKKSTKNSR